MEPERHALLECDECHLVYGREDEAQSLTCRVCGGTEFTYIRNLRTEDTRE
jgi:RNA polymerase subunit RPABC4/transcription elongation factor Spt4